MSAPVIVIRKLRAFVRLEGGGSRILRHGDELPSDLAPGEAERLAAVGALGRKPGTGPQPDAETEEPEVASIDVLEASVQELAAHLAEGKGGKPLNASEVVELAEDEDAHAAAAKARALLAAEHERAAEAKADARSSVTGPLAKLIEADPAHGEDPGAGDGIGDDGGDGEGE